jgi:hypothetical protein
MLPLDKAALRAVCLEVAKTTMWQTPHPKNVRDIITSDEIEECVCGYFESATGQADLLVAAGEDPNLVICAVDYLATFYAIPPMRDDQHWFHEALSAILVLARPRITGLQPSSHPFLDEILQGIAEAKKGSER